MLSSRNATLERFNGVNTARVPILYLSRDLAISLLLSNDALVKRQAIMPLINKKYTRRKKR